MNSGIPNAGITAGGPSVESGIDPPEQVLTLPFLLRQGAGVAIFKPGITSGCQQAAESRQYNVTDHVEDANLAGVVRSHERAKRVPGNSKFWARGEQYLNGARRVLDIRVGRWQRGSAACSQGGVAPCAQHPPPFRDVVHIERASVGPTHAKERGTARLSCNPLNRVALRLDCALQLTKDASVHECALSGAWNLVTAPKSRADPLLAAASLISVNGDTP